MLTPETNKLLITYSRQRCYNQRQFAPQPLTSMKHPVKKMQQCFLLAAESWQAFVRLSVTQHEHQHIRRKPFHQRSPSYSFQWHAGLALWGQITVTPSA